ncbi:MAG: alpha/beta hydrolase, partial [Spirochaetaceae bacterium]|nr:alpha/beta hydrolase [Spirochaetaceae bacterium]
SMEKLTVPSLYVYPEQGLYPMGAPDFIKSQAKAPMELVSIPNAGHLIPMVNPVVVAQAIREFLEKN